jgi:MFS family permease
VNNRLPDSHYSWVRLAASLALAAIAGIGLWAPVVALPTVQAEFGVDRAGASFPYTLTMIGFGIGGLLAGKAADRFGIVPPLALGAVCLALGFIFAANAPSYWSFVILQAFFIGLLGVAPSFGPLVADVSLWFKKRRGIAVAIAASGNYLAGTLWSPLLTRAIEAYGWRTSFIAIGILCVVLMLPLLMVLRPKPDFVQAEPAKSSTGSLSGTPTMQALLVVAGLSCCVAMSMPQVHLIAYCGDLGYGTKAGAQMLSIMLGFGVLSRLVSGHLSDHIGGVGVLIIGSMLQCLALLLYIPFDGLVSLYLVSALFGLSQGGIVPSYALIVRENFPVKGSSFRISMVLNATVFGMALGGWLSGEIFDATGSYKYAFMHGIAWNLLNMSIAFWLFFRKRGLTAAPLTA